MNVRLAHLHANRNWGGGENQLLALARRLHARGIFMVLVTPADGALYPLARRAGLRTFPFPDDAAGRRQLALDLEEFSLTHLNAQDSGSTSLGLFLRRKLGIPLVLTRRIASPLRRNPLSRWKYSPRRLDGVIAVSETVRDVMVRSGYPAAQIQVVGDGIDVAALARIPAEPEFRASYGGDFLVGGLGSLTPKKNWMLMVRAAEILARASFPVQWLLAGDGPDRAELEAAIGHAGLADRFHLLGFRADSARLLRQLDALCFPSRMEGASVTVREAMALGVPVVAADAPGVVESLAGHGWTSGADDPQALADHVREALQDAGLRQTRVAAARRQAQAQYDYETTVAGTLAAYAAIESRR